MSERKLALVATREPAPKLPETHAELAEEVARRIDPDAWRLSMDSRRLVSLRAANRALAYLASLDAPPQPATVRAQWLKGFHHV